MIAEPLRSFCEDVMSSSPDPLNESPSDQRTSVSGSPSKRRSSRANANSRRQSSQPDRSSSSASNKNSYPPLSPSRTVTEQTISPWKIRVTVEAEPEERATEGRVNTFTETTTIPLRGGSSPLQFENTVNTSRRRGSGSRSRSRARSASKGGTRQRSTTPVQERSRRPSVTDLDIVVLGDDQDEDEWRQTTRRSRNRKISERSQAKTRQSDDKTPRISSLMDEGSGLYPCDMDDTCHDDGILQPGTTDSPAVQAIDLNKVSIRPRSNSNRQKTKTQFDADLPLLTKEPHNEQSKAEADGIRKVSVNSVRSYPTPSPTPSEPDVATENDTEVDHADGFDTIMESEGFTMIDLDSIPSAQQLRNSPAEHGGGNESVPPSAIPLLKQSATPTSVKPFPSYLHLAEDESEISSAVPSSPPFPTSQLKQHQHQSLGHLQIPSSSMQPRHRQVTPQTYSSPRLPSPPRSTPPKDRSDADASKAVTAGILLQGAIKPVSKTASDTKIQKDTQTTPKGQSLDSERQSNELFEGFDSGTQRELRAGLRFGEELAKRHQPSPLTLETRDTNEPQASSIHVRRQEGIDHQTPPSPIMQIGPKVHSTPHPWSARRPSMLKHVTLPSDSSSPVTSKSEVVQKGELSTRDARDCISDRHAVEPEIHDITMEDANEDDGDDIWLAEAKDSSSSPRPEDPETAQSDQSYQREGRSGINPDAEQHYRKDSSRTHIDLDQMRPGISDENMTVLTNGDDESSVSGLYWKDPGRQDFDVRFGAGQINHTRRELRKSGVTAFLSKDESGIFDVGKMLGTPKRIRDSLEQQTQHQRLEQLESRDKQNETPVEEDSALYQQQTTPVQFNESSVAEIETPSRCKTRRSTSPPRSAIKGSRKSFSATAGEETDDSDPAERKVMWARRSSHMNEDWIESSRSMISDETSDVQIINQEQQLQSLRLDGVNEQNTEQHFQEKSESPIPATEQRTWLGWLRSPKENPSKDTVTQEQQQLCSSPSVQETATGRAASTAQVSTTENSEWESTSRSAATASLSNQSSKTSSKSSRTKLPSYLLRPSYPSDPKRDPNIPMSIQGQFTNVHFRTLHIIYAKSSRPRFHAPEIEECRPEIRKLVTNKWQLYINEDRAGLGGFNFKMGEKEGRVLERFCREIEWGYLCPLYESGEIRLDELLGPNGMWGGLGHGQSHGQDRGVNPEIKWGWKCEQLAEWLGRIIVGEVVRDEEMGGKNYKK